MLNGNFLVTPLQPPNTSMWFYGQFFAAGYPGNEKLSEVMGTLNETSLSQLRRDHETRHLGHKIEEASK